MRNILFSLPLLGCIFCLACSKPSPAAEEPRTAAEPQGEREAFIDDYWRWSFGDAGLPDELARKVADSAALGPDFMMELLEILEGDSYLYILVDKQHALPEGYEPDDLVELLGGSYQISRQGLMLRRAAAASLEEMALAAGKEGVTLVAGSAYRSAAYQAVVYAREVNNYGQEAADRESARPGHSQHQTGLALDFAPIEDAFAGTAAGTWLLKNAGSFGWSLSFPDGYEAVTGYRWESWHYRYVGNDLVRFIDTYFDGIQQYALQFINAWIESSESSESKEAGV